MFHMHVGFVATEASLRTSKVLAVFIFVTKDISIAWSKRLLESRQPDDIQYSRESVLCSAKGWYAQFCVASSNDHRMAFEAKCGISLFRRLGNVTLSVEL